MATVKAYRARAVGFQKLAARTEEATLRDRLNELASAYFDVANAIERNPEFEYLDDLPRPTLLH